LNKLRQKEPTQINRNKTGQIAGRKTGQNRTQTEKNGKKPHPIMSVKIMLDCIMFNYSLFKNDNKTETISEFKINLKKLNF